jgi:hypothetical protein
MRHHRAFSTLPACLGFVTLGVVACGNSATPRLTLDASAVPDAYDASQKTTHDASHAGDASHPTADAEADSADASGASCHAALAAPDRTRKVVVSHPFNNSQNAASDFEVFELDDTGNLAEANVHFKLGPTTDGRIAFTPDGLVGLVAEDDGTLGVFRFDASGAPVVIDASFTGTFYATRVVMGPTGDFAYVLDDQTEDNGGGIYTVSIACDGQVKDEGILVGAKLPATVIPLTGGTAVVAAKSALGVPMLVDAGGDASDAGGNDAVLIAWPDAGKVLGTADPFGDDQAIVSDMALTQDGRFLLLGDHNGFSSVPNRIGIIAVGPGTLAAAGVIADVNDPESITPSPFDDTLLVTSAFGNALFVIDGPTDGGATSFTLRGELTYTGAAPQLPAAAVLIDRGSLRGRVLVAENQAIRQVQFAAGASVIDLGGMDLGGPNDLASIVGCIGVQP